MKSFDVLWSLFMYYPLFTSFFGDLLRREIDDVYNLLQRAPNELTFQSCMLTYQLFLNGLQMSGKRFAPCAAEYNQYILT